MSAKKLIYVEISFRSNSKFEFVEKFFKTTNRIKPLIAGIFKINCVIEFNLRLNSLSKSLLKKNGINPHVANIEPTS